MVACSLVFWLGLFRWVSKKSFFLQRSIQRAYSSLLLTGSLLVNSTGDQGFTYNVISVSLFQLIIGLFMAAFDHFDKKSITKELVVVFIIGALLFALFMVKFPNCVLLTPMLLVLLIYRKRNAKTIIYYSLMAAAGVLCMGLVVWGGFQGCLVSLDYRL